MSPLRFPQVPFLFALGAITLPLAAQPLTIETVVVGEVGNAADPLNSGNVPGIGSVGYSYHLGKYEVTNAQYTFFLNAVAASDPYGLYNPAMQTSGSGVAFDGGITRSGSPGFYSYEVKSGYENKPVIYVSFWDAARFTNWLGTGYTEGRASSLDPLLPGASYDTGFVAIPSFAAGNRLGGASIWVPSENEWYKAAYHQPASAGGDSDDYWLYATGGNTQPTSAVPGPGLGQSNYLYNDGISNGINGGYAVTQGGFVPTVVYLTDVGIYGAGSESYSGTADQNGNVLEWNDTDTSAGVRGIRGGSWDGTGVGLESNTRLESEATYEDANLGFRVASFASIPEPGSYAAAVGALALAGALARRRRA
jgi:formylglycine-generating enzyme